LRVSLDVLSQSLIAGKFALVRLNAVIVFKKALSSDSDIFTTEINGSSL